MTFGQYIPIKSIAEKIRRNCKPVDDTTLNNSEIKSSDSLTSSENKDKKGKVTDYF
jgi:hypothetical protein